MSNSSHKTGLSLNRRIWLLWACGWLILVLGVLFVAWRGPRWLERIARDEPDPLRREKLDNLVEVRRELDREDGSQ